MSRPTIAAVMAASKTARPAIDQARAILNRTPGNLQAYREKIAVRHREFNQQCRGLS